MPAPANAALADRLRSAAPAAGVALALSMQPCVRFAARAGTDDEIAVGASKFGGAPGLPANAPWPKRTTRESEERPLQFFPHIDLAAAAAAAPSPLALPSQGLLGFMVDFDMEGGGIVGLYAVTFGEAST